MAPYEAPLTSPDILPCRFPVLHERRDAVVGEHMFEQRQDDGWWGGDDVGADFCGLQYVHRVAHAGDEDFGVERVIVVDQADVVNELHAVKAIIVMTPHERRDESRARLCREQRLIGRKAERHIDLRAFARQRLAGLETIDRERHLDADIVRNLAQHFGLFHHRGVIERDDFRRHRAIGQPADFLGHFHNVPARLFNQRRVGGHAIEQAGGGKVTNGVCIGSVSKEFHERQSPDNDMMSRPRYSGLRARR